MTGNVFPTFEPEASEAPGKKVGGSHYPKFPGQLSRPTPNWRYAIFAPFPSTSTPPRVRMRAAGSTHHKTTEEERREAPHLPPSFSKWVDRPTEESDALRLRPRILRTPTRSRSVASYLTAAAAVFCLMRAVDKCDPAFSCSWWEAPARACTRERVTLGLGRYVTNASSLDSTTFATILIYLSIEVNWVVCSSLRTVPTPRKVASPAPSITRDRWPFVRSLHLFPIMVGGGDGGGGEKF